MMLRSAWNAVRDAIFLADLETGRVIDANPAAEALSGRSLAELQALDFTQLYYPLAPGPDGRGFEKAARLAGLTEGSILHKDGHRIPVEVSDSHFSGPDGRDVWIGVFRDVTERRQAEEALRQSEKIYRAIGESIDYGVWVCAPDGRNTYASESFLKLVGQTQEQCSNFGWGDVLHPEDAERTIAAWKECARTEGRWDIEHRFRGADGEWHPILARGVPVRDEQGRISCWAGINLDISELKRAQERLQESENRARAQAAELRAIMDAAPAAILTAHDPECRHLSGNRTAQALMCEQHRGIEIPPWKLPIQTAASTGQPVRNCEVEVVFPDGASTLLMGNVEPMLDDSGRPQGAVAVLTDITARKKEELELRKFVSLADNSGEFVGICDMNFMPFYANQTALQLVGLDSLEQAARTPVPEFFFPEDQRFITEQFFPRVVRDGRAEVEIRFRHFKTGQPVWMIYNVFYIKDAAGRPVGLATVSRDITERKRAEAALRDSEQQLRSLAGSLLTAQEDERRRLSRELHDDVTQRLAFLSIELANLAAEIPDSLERTQARVRTLREQTLRMAAEVRRLSHGLHPSVIEDFGLSIALEEFCHEFGNAKGIEVRFEGFVEDSRLDAASATCLYRVAQESLRNAEFHGHATRIHVELTASAESIRLRVRDNGTGFSTDNVRTQTGLGLISMRERIRFVHGKLTISSQPGHGTEITATVPLTGAVHETSAHSAG